MKIYEHQADICVIGAGLAGMCAAIAAARHGSKVILVNDRPVLGGNASSEIRMWPLGAHGHNRRETGIFEEIVLENLRRNPTRIYPVWDGVLFDAVKKEPNLELILNCSIYDAETEQKSASNDDSRHILSVAGWQLTTYQHHKITADIFIDCSGDSILADLTGAEYRVGREAREEFGEEAAPLEADTCTMGNSCMIQVRETDREVPFTPPDFIRPVTEKDLENRIHDLDNFRATNFWWLELGGDRDSLNDAETIRDDLVALSYGAWNHIKNDPGHHAENWELDWAGWLPGKRESRRYMGDHILTQPEVLAGGRFDDIVAYGGWPIDDHPPKGFDHHGAPNHNWPSPSPFGIPYRCLYSKNIDNLMFAGRNISVTHAAMASSRVMATCAILGQAAGTGAAVAITHKASPRGVYLHHMTELQQFLMDDDCWLPGLKRPISTLCANAFLETKAADKENLRNGIDRPTDEEGDNGCLLPLGIPVTYRLAEPAFVDHVRLVLDSDLDRATVKGGVPSVKDCPTICNRPYNMPPYEFPTTMTSDFDILADGKVIASIRGNRQRLVRIPVETTVSSISFLPLGTTASKEEQDSAHIFSFDFE